MLGDVQTDTASIQILPMPQVEIGAAVHAEGEADTGKKNKKQQQAANKKKKATTVAPDGSANLAAEVHAQVL